MAHHQSSHQQEQKTKTKDAFYAGMTPPPSYHSFEGLWMNQTIHPGGRVGTEVQNGVREPQTTTTRHLKDESRPRDHGRKHHHRSRRSSTSHNSSWTAKLVFRGLQSGLLGSENSTDRNSRDAKDRASSSRKTKMDFSTGSRDVHYTIHNHWHATNPSEHISRTNTGTLPSQGHQRIRHPHHHHHPFAHVVEGMYPEFGVAAHKLAELPLFQDHPTLVEELLCGFDQYLPQGLDTTSLFQKIFGHDPLGRHEHEAPPFPPSFPEFWQNGGQPSTSWPFHDDPMHGYCPHPAAAVYPPKSSSSPPQPPTDRNQSSNPDQEIPHPTTTSNTHPSASTSTSAADLLATYNAHWSHITNHPPSSYPSPPSSPSMDIPLPIPWPPTIRPQPPSFDHTKCDVFSFFARGCGLEPDRCAAPRLDFKLHSRCPVRNASSKRRDRDECAYPQHPYPSYAAQQRGWERQRLEQFRRQMQKEKLRWHEDRVRRRWPGLVVAPRSGGKDGGYGDGGFREDDERERWKAVWAAVKEGSEVCERRLRELG